MILNDRAQIGKAMNATVITIGEAPNGYRGFDRGCRKKFVSVFRRARSSPFAGERSASESVVEVAARSGPRPAAPSPRTSRRAPVGPQAQRGARPRPVARPPTTGPGSEAGAARLALGRGYGRPTSAYCSLAGSV